MDTGLFDVEEANLAPAAVSSKKSSEKSSSSSTAKKKSVQPDVDEKIENISHFLVPEFETKRERIDCFKEMLEEHGVKHDDSFSSIVGKISSDPRFFVLKTKGERNAAFNEYIQHQEKISRETTRIRRLELKQKFQSMLEECTKLTVDCNYRQAKEIFQRDSRWIALNSDSEREELFYDYMDELEEKERKRARLKKQNQITEFREFLLSLPGICSQYTWSNVVDKVDPEDPRFSALEKVNRLQLIHFVAYISLSLQYTCNLLFVPDML